MSEPARDPDQASEASATAPSAVARPGRRFWLGAPLVTLLSIFTVLLLLLFWVLGTQSGLRFSLSLVDRMVPNLLQVERVQGRILGDLHLEGLRVQTPKLRLALGSFDLRWSPLGALSGTLRISELTLRRLDIATAPAEDEEESGPIELPPIALPLQIELEQALLEDLSIGTLDADESSFRVSRVALAASWAGSALSLHALALSLPEPLLEASAKGEAQLTGDVPLDLTLTWNLFQKPALKLEGKAKVGGSLKALKVEHDLTGSAHVKLQALVRETLNRPSWDGKVEIQRVDLPSIQADLPAVDLTGELTTSGDLDEARVQGRVIGEAPDLPDFGHLDARLDISWREQILNIVAVELSEDKSGALLTADGKLDLSDPVGQIDLHAVWEKLRWPLTGELVAEARQGKLDLGGTLEAYSYRVTTQAWGRDFPEAMLDLTGKGSPEATRIEDLRIETMDGEIQGGGKVAWAPEVGWDLTLTAAGIDPGAQWPDLSARIGFELATEGNLDAFRYGLSAKVAGKALPAGLLALNGRGDSNGTRVETLRLDTLGGHLQAKADVAWNPAVRWDAELDVADIDPGRQWPEWGGSLGGRLLSAGILEQAGPNLSARIESLKGRLRGYPVDAAAQVQMQGTEIRIEQLRVASGPSNLQAAGTVGERLDVEFGLSSPDLKSLLPDAQGSIKVSGTASGTLDAPAVKLGLSADAVAVAGQRIQSLSGSANIELAQDGPLKIDLIGKGLEAGGMVFDTLKVVGDGDMGSHRLSAQVTGEPLALELKTSGGLKADNAYAGRLEGLDLRTSEFGNWRLQKPAPVALAGARISAGPLCIREEAGSGGCIDFEQKEAGSWTAALDLDRLAFEMFSAFIPDDLALEGEARAKANFKAAGGALSGKATLQVPKGILSAGGLGRGPGRASPTTGRDARAVPGQLVDFTSTNLAIDAGGNGLQAKLAVPLRGLGDLSGDISLPGWSLADPARPDQSLRGGVQARVDDLDIVSRFVPDITNLTGGLRADFKIGGTIAKPGLSGAAGLANAGLEVPLIGLKIQDMAFNADARNERIDYSGGFRAGKGRLEIAGQTVLAAQGATTHITAKGDKLTLADSKEYFVLAGADVAVDVDSTGTRVTGTVRVPEARIHPRSLPAGSVISPSPDVVLASEASEEPSRYATSIDLRLALGKAVTVKAFGLEGTIRGQLAVLQAPGKEILGDGELKIVDGTYRIAAAKGLTAAIGKPLKIEQGFLTYAKTPINNPFLVLTAQREGGDTTAGLRVFGTIKNPKMTFFSSSDPGMSSSEVTTYLLTGIPPKRGGEQEADRGLSLGTYVAPKLFAEYDYSLGSEADKIKLRYDLNDWIELQTETGESQGGDIFLKFEN